ncbi:ComEA family DNA-binding protein [Flavobacterium terrae]|uniref:DNA uptake protein ComE n=1 Tax=Flavobacterium terrae TaxID=415425 RepID=A0A1M6DHV0_9FLAO|nr:helix-hairpin-helix domain-containing protein [Flavobacterium terrae]SHI72775.1 DNA uptake protein ComE [Flavobacterium terrae]
MIFEKFLYFNKEQRIGIALLVFLIVLLQAVYFSISFYSVKDVEISDEGKKWLALQVEIDSLKNNTTREDSYKMYPFNPNFITDFKGYKLGMKVAEIDRLLEFRKSGKFVNSAQEFQKVTQVSDSLLAKISPYFKFPDWVNNKNVSQRMYAKKDFNTFEKKPEKIVQKDLNEATKEDLIKIYGIGDGISERILKFKESLGGFVSMEQMNDVWGLSPEVIAELNKYFKISNLPSTTKIDINNASTKELSKFPYFKFSLSREIVTYRSMNGEIKSIEDLIKIKGFPVEKVKIIALYLDFK